MQLLKSLSCAALIAATPVIADDTEEGFDLMEKGAQMLLRGLMNEMEPAIDDMRSMMEEFGPALDEFAVELGPILAEILNRVDDIRHYEQPEILPNGDIIIRRSPDAPQYLPNTGAEEKSIDL